MPISLSEAETTAIVVLMESNMALGLRPRRHRQEAPRPGRLALHFVTDPLVTAHGPGTFTNS